MSKPYQIPPMYLNYTAESVERFPRYKIMHDKTDNFFFIYVKFAMPHHGLTLQALKGEDGEQLRFATLEDAITKMDEILGEPKHQIKAVKDYYDK